MADQASGVPAAARWWRRRPADWLVCGLVVLMALKACYAIRSARDADVADEMYYMERAVSLSSVGMPPPQWSPLYVLHYAGLSLAQPDLERLHALNWTALVLAWSAGLFALARALGAGPLTALAAAAAALTSSLVDVYPYVGYLAATVLAFGLSVAVRRRSLASASLAAALTLLLASYVRPEYFLAFAACSALSGAAVLWGAWRYPERRRPAAGWLAAVALAAGAAWAVFGLPFGPSPDGTDRTFAAFGQHYALGKFEASAPAGTDPWESGRPNPWVYWRDYLKADFGEAATLGEAAAANPDAFAGHVGRNALNFARVVKTMLAPAASAPWLVNYRRWVLCGALLVGLLGLLGVAVGLRRGTLPALRNAGVWLAVLPLGAVAGAVCLGLYPRQHYVLPMLTLLGALAAAGLSALPGAGRLSAVNAWPAVVAAAALWAAVVPNRAERTNADLLAGRPAARPAKLWIHNVVALAKSLGLKGPVNCLDLDMGVCFYSHLPHKNVFMPHDKAEPFWDYVRRRGVNMVVLHPVLGEHPQLRNDPQFLALWCEKELGDFEIFTPPGTPIRLAVHRDLLSSPPPFTDPPQLGPFTDTRGMDPDGWARGSSGVALPRPAGAQRLVVQASVPQVAGPAFKTRFRLNVNGRQLAAREVSPGPINLAVLVPEASEEARVDLEFDRVQTLPNGDGRSVGARIHAVRWDDTPAAH